MAIVPTVSNLTEPEYPTGDSRPVGETPLHRDNLLTSVKVLERYFAGDPLVYVSGNMFVYYERGNRRKHVSPDVFAVFDVPKDKRRDAYFVWEEDGHVPDVVIELTSASTKEEDLDDKMYLYKTELRVREYFLFDPRGEYLDPSLQGYRLRGGEYLPIETVDGRLPSEVLGLHLERGGENLRFYDPANHCWLPTPDEREEALEAERDREQNERILAEAERARAEAERDRLAAELAQSGAEFERLRKELETLRQRFGEPPNSTTPNSTTPNSTTPNSTTL